MQKDTYRRAIYIDDKPDGEDGCTPSDFHGNVRNTSPLEKREKTLVRYIRPDVASTSDDAMNGIIASTRQLRKSAASSAKHVTRGNWVKRRSWSWTFFPQHAYITHVRMHVFRVLKISVQIRSFEKWSLHYAVEICLCIGSGIDQTLACVLDHVLSHALLRDEIKIELVS